jgi:hypothetical protein
MYFLFTYAYGLVKPIFCDILRGCRTTPMDADRVCKGASIVSGVVVVVGRPKQSRVQLLHTLSD